MESKNKTALITGGSRGLGKNEALTLAQRGNDVIITYNNKKDDAEKVVAQIKAMGCKAAALQLNTGEVKTFGAFKTQLTGTLQQVLGKDKIDFLINNAGIDSPSAIAATTEDSFDTLMNIHFKGVYFLTQALLPLIANGGRIINTSTGLTRFTSPGYAAYASMKGAVETFTKYLAKEVGSRGITANMVAPGIIETDFTQAARQHPGLTEFLSSQTALGRIGQPDDIGGVVAFLCSDDARWVTGQRIEASGGMFL